MTLPTEEKALTLHIQDWRVADDVPMPDEHRQVYTLTVSTVPGEGICIEVSPRDSKPLEDENVPQLQVLVYISDGVPHLNISHELGSDGHLHVSTTSKGLVVEPEQAYSPFQPFVIQ